MIVKLICIGFQFSLKLSWYNINNLKNICFLTNESLLNSSYAWPAIKPRSGPASRCTGPSSGSLPRSLAFSARCTWRPLGAGRSVLSEECGPGREGDTKLETPVKQKLHSPGERQLMCLGTTGDGDKAMAGTCVLSFCFRTEWGRGRPVRHTEWKQSLTGLEKTQVTQTGFTNI